MCSEHPDHVLMFYTEESAAPHTMQNLRPFIDQKRTHSPYEVFKYRHSCIPQKVMRYLLCDCSEGDNTIQQRISQCQARDSIIALAVSLCGGYFVLFHGGVQADIDSPYWTCEGRDILYAPFTNADYTLVHYMERRDIVKKERGTAVQRPPPITSIPTPTAGPEDNFLTLAESWPVPPSTIVAIPSPLTSYEGYADVKFRRYHIHFQNIVSLSLQQRQELSRFEKTVQWITEIVGKTVSLLGTKWSFDTMTAKQNEASLSALTHNDVVSFSGACLYCGKQISWRRETGGFRRKCDGCNKYS
jgi:hypothetical protein